LKTQEIIVIPSITAILLSFQVIFGAFFVSILEIRGRPVDRRSGP